ncbi:hypothetical protein MRY82_06615 [bacterium]|nr:hypothetical protein [bacterium]
MKNFNEEISNLTYEQCYSESEFSKILGVIFSLPKNEEITFSKKLVSVSKKIRVQLFIVKHNNKVCGCFSLFKTRKNYFILANAGLIQSHRNLGLGYELFKIIRYASTLPIVLDSKEPKLTNTILPKSNYTFLSKIYLVRLEKYFNILSQL